MWKTMSVIAAVGGLALGTGLGTAESHPADDVPGERLPEVTVELGPVEALPPSGQEAGDIVEVASSAGSFQTLLQAAQAAGLVETLKGEGPFTVFAPTDDAFGKLPEGTVESLLQDREKLRAVLTYHVVAGEVTSGQVVELDEAETVNGKKVKIDTRDGNVRINDARVVQADVQASNGVIHVIDSVLLPPEESASSGY
jgi:uncharacterized surface protein with fasciclin (FAS1) repeats